LPQDVANAIPLAWDVDLVPVSEAPADFGCVLFVVDDEVGGQAEGVRFCAEDQGAEGVEGGALHAIGQARCDFAGGAVGEAEAEHALGVDAVVDGAGGAFRESHRFASADRGHDEDGLVPVVDDLRLEVIEVHLLMISAVAIDWTVYGSKTDCIAARGRDRA